MGRGDYDGRRCADVHRRLRSCGDVAQPTITTVNRPVITAFAPMQPVVQTSFMPVISSGARREPVHQLPAAGHRGVRADDDRVASG